MEKLRKHTKDLTKQRFGLLVVTSFDCYVPNGVNGKYRRAKWNCVCDCGNTTSVIAASLLNGATRSCGCYQKKRAAETHTLEKGEAALNSLIGSYVASASVKGLPYALTREQATELFSSSCSYCGQNPSQKWFSARSKAKNRKDDYLLYNGIDRVDNKEGYIISNCVSCCKVCNYAKRGMTKDAFLSWIKKVHAFMVSGGVI